jgi:hypothetical protein
VCVVASLAIFVWSELLSDVVSLSLHTGSPWKILTQFSASVNINNFSFRGEFRRRVEFRQRYTSFRIVTHPIFRPKPTIRSNINPNGCFPVAFVLILSSGSKNPVHLAGKRIGRV